MERISSGFGGPISVLLVEDNPVDLKLLERMLGEQSGAQTNMFKAVSSLKSATDILRKEHIDVVVLDLNLPDSQGLQTLTKINEEFEPVAIVVNTGAYEDDLGLKTLSYGAQDFIVKGKYQSYGLNKAIQYARERKKIELELINAYRSLQEAQAQLIQAEKMNTVGRLASGIAHEVKNPLATILFGVAYLNEKFKNMDENVALTLKNIKEASQRANEIITDLLDFASLSRLNSKFEDVNTVVEKSLELTKHSSSRQGIKIVKELNHSLPQVNIDRNRIEQVIVNLILNALHAMPQGGVLTLRTYLMAEGRSLDDAKGPYTADAGVCVEVDDTGIGIPEDKLGQIFDPFFTTRRAQGGVGLGLSVARNIIDMHQGKIQIFNKPQGGVCARVVLKFAGEEGIKA